MKKKFLILLLLSGTIISCSSEKSSESRSSIKQQEFGTMADGTKIEQYTLSNKNGIELKVITYGGIITNLKIPDRNGNFEDVVLGFDSLDSYVKESPYFGAIIGRYGNRIAKGQFILDDDTISLARNNIGNHLHGGIKGFDKVAWKAEPFSQEEGTGIKLTYHSADGEEGYPGNLDVTVTYLLKDDNTLTFAYEASADKPTVVNLTNHSYYNFTGAKDNILGHELVINADKYLPVDSTLIPLEPAPVSETPFDFTSAKSVGKDINADDIQLKNGRGYDHCWILNPSADSLNFAASLYEPSSGRLMEIYTTEPGIQFYSGNFLDGTLTGKNGVKYNFRTGLCLETEHFPDSPNRPDFPSVVLRPGEVYKTKTVTKFSTK